MALSSQSVARMAAPIRQQVYELLFEAIIQSELLPGERLTERDLCERYSVSRTSVREALRALEGEGLVTMIPNKGPVVTVVRPEEAAQIYQVRAALEGLAGALFAENADKAVRERLKKASTDISRASATAEIPRIVAAKKGFYDALFAGSGNPQLVLQLRSIHARVTFLRSKSLQAPGRIEASLQEIKNIVAATDARDPALSWTACATHVQNAFAAALGELSRESSSLPSDILNAAFLPKISTHAPIPAV